MPVKDKKYYEDIKKDWEKEDDEAVQDAEFAKRYDRITYAGSEKGDLNDYYKLEEIISKRPDGAWKIKKIKQDVDRKYKK